MRNLLIGTILVVLLAVILTFGMVNYTYGHEGNGFYHAKENFTDMVGADNNDPRCPMGTVWKFKNGREVCVFMNVHAVHVKELKGADDEDQAD